MQLCNTPSCVVCDLDATLIGQGAQLYGSNVLREPGCSVRLRFKSHMVCLSRLKLDTPGAIYRINLATGKQNPMCDYSVAALTSRALYALAVELKSGAPKVSSVKHAIVQLQHGLDLLRHVLSEDIFVQPVALLVVGSLEPRLKNVIRSRDSRLRFGPSTFFPKVTLCGKTFPVPFK